LVALVTISTRAGLSVEGLRRVLGVSQPATVRIVDRLADRGLVQRRPGGDGRTLGLWPTRAGADAAAEVLAAQCDAVSAMLVSLAAKEAHQLSALLERVRQSLPGTRDDARHLCRLCDQDLCGPPKCPVTRGIPRPA
jgi:MarR family transcriptional regulator, negative regulator of the multidrug operon emrRAB